MSTPTVAHPAAPARCTPECHRYGQPREGDTVATLAARIREERCGGPGGWMYDPETAAGMMLSAYAQAKRLAARFG